MKGFLVLPILLILLFGTPEFADFQKGLDALNSGKISAVPDIRSNEDRSPTGW